jgi:hypothetical protein
MFGRYQVKILAFLEKVFVGFPQPLQANARIVP